MRVNWGMKVALLYGGFVVLMAILVVGAMNEEWHMVTPDYYAKELSYPDKQKKIARSRSMPERVGIGFEAAKQAVVIQFPAGFEDAFGEVFLIRPSDPVLDHSLKLSLNDLGQHVVMASELQPGLWRVEIDWQHQEKGYFDARMVMVP